MPHEAEGWENGLLAVGWAAAGMFSGVLVGCASPPKSQVVTDAGSTSDAADADAGPGPYAVDT